MLAAHTALFFVILTAAIFHLIPAKHWNLRLSVVILTSVFLIYAIYPLAAVAGVLFAIYAWGIYKLSKSNPLIRKYAPLTLFILLGFFSYFDFKVDRNFYATTIINFGMSFYTFRLYGALRMAPRLKTETTLCEFLALTLFFPIFAAGPIAYQDAFRAAFDKPFLYSDWVMGFFRICAGVFFVHFVSAQITELLYEFSVGRTENFRWHKMEAWEVYVVMMLKFLNLYADFTGYTEIAIGLGMFFGFKIPENFRFPLFTRNIQDFWKRWHLSLSSFIVTYLYLPLAVQFRKPRLALFMSFTLVGLWHQISWQYLVWGVGHGAALVFYQEFSKLKFHSSIPAAMKTAIVPFATILTLSYVAFLSTFANEATLAKSLSFLKALIGL